MMMLVSQGGPQSLPCGVSSTSEIYQQVAAPPVGTDGDLKSLDTSLDTSLVSLSEETPIYRDPVYYLDFIEFLAEDCLFQVPKHHFTKPTSSYFWESLEPVEYRGKAIKLHGIQKADFRALIKFLYPLDMNLVTQPKLTPEEWESILKLAFKWKMDDIFEKAMAALKQAVPLAGQIPLARTYGVYDWLKSTYIKLVERHTLISENEARSLELDAALKLIHIREQLCWTTAVDPNIQLNASDPTVVEHYDEHGSRIVTTVAIKGRFNGAIARELEDLKTWNDAGTIPTTTQQVMLGRTYGVRKWVEDGLRELSERTEPISNHEGAVLGLETTMSLCAARNRVLELNNDYNESNTEAIAKEVMNKFQEELNGLEEINRRYGKPPPEPTPVMTKAEIPKAGRKGKAQQKSRIVQSKRPKRYYCD